MFSSLSPLSWEHDSDSFSDSFQESQLSNYKRKELNNIFLNDADIRPTKQAKFVQCKEFEEQTAQLVATAIVCDSYEKQLIKAQEELQKSEATLSQKNKTIEQQQELLAKQAVAIQQLQDQVKEEEKKNASLEKKHAKILQEEQRKYESLATSSTSYISAISNMYSKFSQRSGGSPTMFFLSGAHATQENQQLINRRPK